MPDNLIDSHCHLHFFKKDEIDDIILDAKKIGVKKILNVCTNMNEITYMSSIANKYDFIYSSIGIHPNNVSSEIDLSRLKHEMENCILDNKKIIAIGETGLDFYKNHTDPELQKKFFITHIDIARNTNLPVIIHSRECDEMMIKILEEEYAKGKFKAVLHSFASSDKLCTSALNMNMYISFSGIITFKNAKDIAKIAKKKVPIDKMLTETDAPYLSPVPMRGKINKPGYVKHIVEFLEQELKNNKIKKAVEDNFNSLFFNS
ncbi:TatD family hydrolase [Anaplasmataceae bacterium AB001_6]|nr:TatD family hydrolase [Anaplasmataceae bacterium AB001_6]